MAVAADHPVEPSKHVQATYARRKLGDADVSFGGVAASSSSPSHEFNTSPTRSIPGDDVTGDDDPSCNTTISSDDEEQGNERIVMARKKPVLFLSDDDNGDDEDEDDGDDDGDDGGEKSIAKEDESNIAYLKRFREARNARLAGTKQRSVPSDVHPSSSLSDPPTLSNSSLSKSHGLLPVSPSSISEEGAVMNRGRISQSSRLSQRQFASLSPDLSPSPHKERTNIQHSLLDPSSQSQISISNSPYITEAQKQREERIRKLSREAKIKELALRKAKAKKDANLIEGTQNEEEEDEVESSTSDIQEEIEEEDLPSAMKVIQDASRRRRLADDRKKATEEASKVSQKSKINKGGVLQMRTDDDSDSDLDFERSKMAKIKETEQPLKAMSKKEEELMNKTQARIERELKASNAKAWNARSEKPIFGLSDLLDKFEQQEGGKKPAHIKRNTTTGDRDDPNNSDPIESASEGENDHQTSKPSLSTINPSQRLTRFTPALKDLSPDPAESLENRKQREDSEKLPDGIELMRGIQIERAQKAKLEALRERKAQALLRESGKAKKEEEEADDDDDVLIIDSKIKTKQNDAVMMKPFAQRRKDQHQITRQGSPGGISEDGSQDDFITDTQIHQAGKRLGRMAPTVVAAEKNSSSYFKGQKVKEEARWTTEELHEKIMKKARMQNIESRRKREAAFGEKKKEPEKKAGVEKNSENVGEMVRKLKEMREQAGEKEGGSQDSDADGSEYNPDGSVQQEEEEEVIDLGSADEDEGDKNDSDSEAESEDSEKENSAPASQDDTVQARMSRRPRIVVDDDEDETIVGAVSSQDRVPLQPIDVDNDNDDDNDTADQLQTTSPAPGAFLDNSSEGGFSQFFQETQLPTTHMRVQPTTSSVAPRNVSSTLGKFFEDTQPDQSLRGESFPVLSDEFGESAMPGFTQLFSEGTQMPVEHNSRLMPPPNTSARGLSLLGGTDQDGFAALRKAQASEAHNLNFDADNLPSLDQLGGLDEDGLAALEMEALQAEIEERQSKEKKMREEANVTYINKDGFFTQTKPEFERYSLSQSQSQSQNRMSRPQWEDQGSSLNSEVEPDMPVKTRKRFRRAVSLEDVDAVSSIVEEGKATESETLDEIRADEDDIEGAKNAFDVLKGAMKMTRKDRSASPPVKVFKNRFVQGEAEESDDEEDGPVNKKLKTKKGGLDGIFSDEEGGSDDEEDEEGDDVDLKELIDEEKDDKEAEKDLLARERYFKDMEADDQAAMALHEKAIRGGLRNKKRAVGIDGSLEGFLDEDYEEEWAERLVKNPYGYVPKKRRLQGKDGLDLLEANEETQAFVRKYRDADNDETELNKYDFLLPAEGDEAGQQDQDQDQEHDGRRKVINDSDDDDDDDEPNEPQILTRQQLQEEIRERKRRKHAVQESEDEDEDEAEIRAEEEAAAAEQVAAEERLMKKIQQDIYGHSSDEDDNDEDDAMKGGQAIVRDRLQEKRRLADLVTAEDDDDTEMAYSELSRIAKSRPLSEREEDRLIQLQNEYANEPEWGNQDGTRKTNASLSNGNASSVTSFGSSRRAMTKSSSSKTNGSSTSLHLHRVRSKLSDVMKRQDQFTESQDD